MKADINGVKVEGTPEEIARLIQLTAVKPAPYPNRDVTPSPMPVFPLPSDPTDHTFPWPFGGWWGIDYPRVDSGSVTTTDMAQWLEEQYRRYNEKTAIGPYTITYLMI